ncbi:MAG: hypothetical protein HYS12_28200, partial [Planctomycetes bacterium]|nr:hypothetical protein [Planctomycetota bacterium]
YRLWVGRTLGASDIADVNTGAGLAAVVNGLPSDGSVVHVRLRYQIGRTWLSTDYTFRAVTGNGRGLAWIVVDRTDPLAPEDSDLKGRLERLGFGVEVVTTEEAAENPMTANVVVISSTAASDPALEAVLHDAPTPIVSCQVSTYHGLGLASATTGTDLGQTEATVASALHEISNKRKGTLTLAWTSRDLAWATPVGDAVVIAHSQNPDLLTYPPLELSGPGT